MANLLLWCYCDKCGRKIMVGETCYDIGQDTYCSDCCKPINTLYKWERSVEAEDDGSI